MGMWYLKFQSIDDKGNEVWDEQYIDLTDDEWEAPSL